MKADSSVTIRINSNIKRKAQQIFSDLGLDITTAINLFLRQAIQFDGLPFDVVLRKPNELTLDTIQKAEINECLSEKFDNIDKLMEALNA